MSAALLSSSSSSSSSSPTSKFQNSDEYEVAESQSTKEEVKQHQGRDYSCTSGLCKALKIVAGISAFVTGVFAVVAAFNAVPVALTALTLGLGKWSVVALYGSYAAITALILVACSSSCVNFSTSETSINDNDSMNH